MKMLKYAAALGVALSFNAFADNCSFHKEIDGFQWIGGSDYRYEIVISNVSTVDVETEIKLLDRYGVRYTESTEAGTQITDFAGATGITDGPVLIRAGDSVKVNLQPGISFGNGKISWKSNVCLPSALQANVLHTSQNRSIRAYLGWQAVNGGNSF